MKWTSDNMDNVEKILTDSWRNIKYYRTGSLQLGIKHPLEWHVAYETPINKALVIICHSPAKNIDPSKSISTQCNKRSDGTYYISFQLTEKSQEDVFISMCSNLIEYSSGADTEVKALNMVETRYRQWRRLMEYKNIAMLSDEKRRGLIGELLYFKKTIEEGKPVSDALAGWVGPDGADQDFVFNERWREVKTTGLSSDKISIHSIEQLGDEGEEGDLIIYRVDPSAPEAEGAFTLRKLVHDITKMFGGSLADIELFTDKLSSIGYIDIEAYDKYPYKYYKDETYIVNADFPRLTRSNMRPEITKCEYTISISSIDNWKRS